MKQIGMGTGTVDYTGGSSFIPGNGHSSCTNRFRAVDYAGNRGPWTEYHHIHMDTEAPSKTAINLGGYASGTLTKENVAINASASDNIGISRYEYSHDGTNVAAIMGYDSYKNPWLIDWDTRFNMWIRAVDYAGNAGPWSDMFSVIRDTTPPTATSCEIKNITASGYDVYVYGVTDNVSGVNRVQFPTWTSSNGQDDIQSDWGNNTSARGTLQADGTTWVYRVNRSAHKNEFGTYNTHVYVYDNVGNMRGIYAKENISVIGKANVTGVDSWSVLYINSVPAVNNVIGRLKNGDQVYIHGESGDWWYVYAHSRKYDPNNVNAEFDGWIYGWVYKGYITTPQ